MGPDKHWFGAWPEIVLDRRGAGVDEIIGQMRAAVANYPLSEYLPSLPRPQQQYLPRAHRPAGPRAEIPLPSNAVGKDFLPGGGLFAAAPSGSGFQVSLYGLIGILLAAREGLEVNLLGLSFGVGPVRPALKLPALGRFRMAGL
jgi:hypothetical protein